MDGRGRLTRRSGRIERNYGRQSTAVRRKFLYRFRNPSSASRALRWISPPGGTPTPIDSTSDHPRPIAPSSAVAAATQNAGCRRLAEELGECVAVDQSARYKSTACRSISGASDRGRDGKANFNRDIARHRHPGRGTNGRSTLSHGLRSQFGKGSGALVAGCCQSCS